jgi:general nucleoside transport system permease protein
MADFILNWLVSCPVFATPLLLACLGLIVTARAGVLNLGAEGMMAISGFFGIMTVLNGGTLFWAVIIAVLMGALLSLVFGIATVVFKTDQVLTGLIIASLGLGISGVVGKDFAHRPIQGFDGVHLSVLTDIPWIGPIIFGQDILVYITAITVVLVWRGIHFSTIGLRLRAVGEDPPTADSAGVNVIYYRLGAVVVGGSLCGLSGAYLTLAAGQVWVEHMVAGRGWIAIALAIFARWRPFPAVLGALIFGGTEAIIPRIQTLGGNMPVYFLMMLPYLLTLAVLILPYVLIKGWRDEAPSGLMQIFLREERR